MSSEQPAAPATRCAGVGALARRVADAADAAARRSSRSARARPRICASWPAPLSSARQRQADRVGGRLDRREHDRVGGDRRRRTGPRSPSARTPAARGDGRRPRRSTRGRAPAEASRDPRRAARRSRTAAPGTTLRTLGAIVEVPAGGDPHRAVAGHRLDREHHLGRGGERVAGAGPSAWCRRGSAAPDDLDVDGLAAGDAGDHAEVVAAGVEHRAPARRAARRTRRPRRCPSGRGRATSGSPPASARRSRQRARRRRRARPAPSAATSPTSARLPTMPSVPRAPSSLANATTSEAVVRARRRRRGARRRPRPRRPRRRRRRAARRRRRCRGGCRWRATAPPARSRAAADQVGGGVDLGVAARPRAIHPATRSRASTSSGPYASRVTPPVARRRRSARELRRAGPSSRVAVDRADRGTSTSRHGCDHLRRCAARRCAAPAPAPRPAPRSASWLEPLGRARRRSSAGPSPRTAMMNGKPKRSR